MMTSSTLLENGCPLCLKPEQPKISSLYIYVYRLGVLIDYSTPLAQKVKDHEHPCLYQHMFVGGSFFEGTQVR